MRTVMSVTERSRRTKRFTEQPLATERAHAPRSSGAGSSASTFAFQAAVGELDRSPDRRRSGEPGSRLRAESCPPAAAEPAARDRRADGPRLSREPRSLAQAHQFLLTLV